MAISLGPFDITTPLGKGGMGEVWSGVHRQHGTPVAVKIITGRMADDIRFQRGFHREVQAVAGLMHPNIVGVYDYGLISREAEQASDAALRRGSPWLAMELATRGSLEDLSPPRNWAVLRRLLLEILNALAHAHARGIVHRDLKPGNVLLTDGPRDSLRLKLTDFGIAHVTDPTQAMATANVESITAGTPLYMPPEQLNGRWRDYGPWSDLYALGCMTFELVTGHLPFNGSSLLEVAMKHMSDPLPALKPLFEVPEGLEAWIGCLVEKSRDARFQFAADAASALYLLPHLDAQEPDPVWQPELIATDTTSPMVPTLGAHALAQTLESVPESPPSSANYATQMLPDQVLAAALQADQKARTRSSPSPSFKETYPALATTWKSTLEDHDTSTATMLGAGLGLFGLREVPFVDRNPARDLIWNTLTQVHGEGRARVIFVHGEAGQGKTRLVEWITRRMSEVGAATILRAFHSPMTGPSDGLPCMIQRHMQALSLSREKLHARIVDRLEAMATASATIDAPALTQLMLPRSPGEADDDIPVVQFGQAVERYAVIERYLEVLTRTRPVVIWIEDAHWAKDSLGFLQYFVERQAHNPIPVLVLATVRDNSLEERPLEAERIAKLNAREEVNTVHLSPLSADDHATLIRDLISLEDSLAREVHARTLGNPLLAVELVGDWVERGVLMRGPRGYALRDGVQITIPDNAHDVCMTRLRTLTNSLEAPEGAWRALEVAAVLGQDVLTSEWQAICQELGIPIPDDLVVALLQSGMANHRNQGWAFSQGLIRDSLERAARAGGRLAQIHRVCAANLHAHTENGTCPQERSARHLLAAGDLAQALDPLFQAISDRLTTSSYAEALELCRVHDETVNALNLAPLDEKRVRIHSIRAEALRYSGRLEEANLELNHILTVATDAVSPKVLADAMRVNANLAYGLGDLATGRESYLAALQLYKSIDDYTGISRVMHGLGWLDMNRHQVQAATQWFEQGRKFAQLAQNVAEEAWCMQGTVEVMFRGGDLAVEELNLQALNMFRSIGNRSGAGACLRSLGDLARLNGDLDAAQKHFEEATALWQAAGSPLEGLGCISLGLLAATLDDFDALRGYMLYLHEHFEHRIPQPYHVVIDLGMMFCCAQDRDYPRWDMHLQEARAQIAETGFSHPSAYYLPELAGRLLEDQGQLHRASQAFMLGVDLCGAIAPDKSAEFLKRAQDLKSMDSP